MSRSHDSHGIRLERGTALRAALLAVPLLAAIVFVRSHASPLPLTDEWSFTQAIVSLQGVDLLSREGLARAVEVIPARFVDHWVLVPFLVYWPIEEWAGFDARWIGALARGLTTLGGPVWGSWPAVFDFDFDRLSATGLVVLLCTAAIVARAAAVRALPRLALALAVTAFGLLSVATIAVSRECIGNWHFQFALPAICGAYAAGHALWKEDRSWFSALPFLALLAVLVTSLFGYYKGFAQLGPGFQAYVRTLEAHARKLLRDPDDPKPYPPPVEIDAGLVLFLSAHEHPLFDRGPQPRVVKPLPAAARVFVDEHEVAAPFGVLGGGEKIHRLTVSMPLDARSRGVLARIGGAELVLRMVHGRNAGLACCEDPGVVCFSGSIVPRLIAPGVHRVELALFE